MDGTEYIRVYCVRWEVCHRENIHQFLRYRFLLSVAKLYTHFNTVFRSQRKRLSPCQRVNDTPDKTRQMLRLRVNIFYRTPPCLGCFCFECGLKNAPYQKDLRVKSVQQHCYEKFFFFFLGRGCGCDCRKASVAIEDWMSNWLAHF